MRKTFWRIVRLAAICAGITLVVLVLILAAREHNRRTPADLDEYVPGGLVRLRPMPEVFTKAVYKVQLPLQTPFQGQPALERSYLRGYAWGRVHVPDAVYCGRVRGFMTVQDIEWAWMEGWLRALQDMDEQDRKERIPGDPGIDPRWLQNLDPNRGKRDDD